MSIFSVGASTPAADSAVESKSVRLDRASTAYLKKAFPFSTNKKTWTFSCWSKRADVATGYQQGIFASDTAASPGDISGLDWWDTGALCWRDWRSGSTNNQLITTALYKDPAAWYHIVVAYDTTQATASNRIKMYVNGEQVTDFSTANYPSQNYEGAVNYGTSSLDRLHGIGHNTGFNDSSSQYIAEVNFLDGTALDASYFGETDSNTNQWKPKAAEDIKAAVTFGTHGFYLPFSNDVLASSFLDTGSGSRHTVTAVGNVHTDTTIKKLGTASAQFDGTGDALTCPDSSDFTLVDAMFTLEAYVYLSNTNRQVFISKYDESGNNREFKWEYESNNMMFGYSTNGSSNTWLSFAWTPSVDTWYHIAICRDGSSTIRAFVDGTQIGSNQVVSSSFYNGSALLSIGVNIHNGSPLNSGLTGYMDEIRICNIGKYTYNFTPPTVAFESDTRTKLLLHCDGSDGGTSFTDSATHTITANADAKNVRVSNHSVSANADAHIIGPKVGSSAIAFDGDGDYLNAASSTDFDFGSGAFTVEGWYNMTAPDSGGGFAGMGNRQGSSPYNGWMVEVYSGTMYFYFHNGSNINVNWSWTPQNNRWYHIAFARSGNLIDFWIDGVSQGSKAITGTLTASNAGFKLGGQPSNSSYDLNGYADEQRISNVARYTLDTDFTPATTAFANDSNTKLLIHSNTTMGSTTFTDSSSGGHTITKSGTPKHVVPKIGTGMGVFDGTGDYLSVPASNQFDFSTTGQFTIEFWCNIAVVTGHQALVHSPNYYVAGNNGNWAIDMYQGDVRMNLYNGTGAVGSVDCSGTNITAGQWHHVAVARDSGGTTRIFVDGTLRSPASTNFNGQDIEDGKNGVEIGGNISYAGPGDLKGYVDEVRISQTARYTSNFTPTTTAYTDDIDTVLLLHMDGGGPGTQGSSTNIGQGTYFYDDSTNAIFYDSGVPKYKSLIKTPTGNANYLSTAAITYGSADFTIEFWAKSIDNDPMGFFCSNYSSGADHGIYINDSGSTTQIYTNWSGGTNSQSIAKSILNWDYWHHIAVVRDGNDLEVFTDGISRASSTISGTMVGNAALCFGRNGTDTSDGEGLFDSIRISNNARYTSNFTPPTDRFTSDANTLMLIQSDFTEGGIGADHSGNYNYFTPNNLGAHDMVEDGPTNNFCTLNPLVPTTPTLSEGNLKGVSTSTSTVSNTAATFSPTSGKWYWEICLNSLNLNNSTGYVQFNIGGGAYIWSYYNTPTTQIVSNATTAISNFGAGDILQFAVDIDNGKAWFGNNGTWYTTSGTPNPSAGTGQAYTFTYSGDFWTVGMARFQMRSGSDPQIATCNFGQDSSFAGYKNDNTNPQPDANGKGDFYYAPPAGYLALCTDNLDDPAIALPTDYFNTATYAGTGASQTIAVGFQPDFVWAKCRTTAVSNVLYDSVRGTGRLESNNTNAEGTRDGFAGFDSNGFDVDSDGGGGGINYPSGRTYVAWNWKAGGTASSNSDGTETVSLSANPTAGFSIIAYTGTGTTDGSDTVGHGLSQAPELYFVKARTEASHDWNAYAEPIGVANYVALNLTNASAAQSNGLNHDEAPTSSVITLGSWNAVNESSKNFIIYAFHSVEGYSKVGKYTGNGNANGTFIYTGFRPAWLLIKKYDGTEDWIILDNKRDSYNVVRNGLYADLNNAEGASDKMDFLSNGFKMRSTTGVVNSSANFLYLAFAESPFKTANAR